VPALDAILSVKGLTKEHGTGAARVQALRGVDLEVRPEEFVAVTGASGSGKSTLLHLAAGLDRPTAGSIRVAGIDLAGLGDDERTILRRRCIGLVFQSFHLLDMLSAEENVALPLAICGRCGAEARRQAVRALERVGLGQRRWHRPHELSGGEQQRVAIARALANDPLLLLADEPTGSLDSVQGTRIIDLLRGLADERRQTLLLVTHDAAHARLADRALTLQDGRFREGRCARQFAGTLEAA
jgi:predicted ABC-type transport system involved in lysophospholipase L1 biosynthesis ATPase subunit